MLFYGKSFTVLLTFLLFFSTSAFTGVSQSKTLGKKNHFSSIGYVDINGYTGTASYIGDNLVITVAHNLMDYINKSSNAQLTEIQGTNFLKVTGFTRDDFWDNAYNSEGDVEGYDIEYAIVPKYYKKALRSSYTPSDAETRSDIAIIKIKGHPSVVPLKLVSNVSVDLKVAVVVGYGANAHGMRQAFAQEVKMEDLKTEGLLISDVERDGVWKKTQSDETIKTEMTKLLGGEPTQKDSESLVATGGLSGGPLLAIGTDGSLQAIALLSKSTDPGRDAENIYVPLVTTTGGLKTRISQMIAAAKK